MSKRARALVVVGWTVAGLSLFGVAAVLWRALRAATLPRVHVDGTAVPGGVAADPSGGVFAAFTTNGSIDVGCGDPWSDRGMVLVRFDDHGKCAWKKPVRGAGALDAASSAKGDVVLAADVYDNADFGFGPTPSFSSLAIVSYDSAGKARWARALDARVAAVPAQRSRRVVAISRDGSLVAALVATHNGADLGTGKLATRDTKQDAAVVMLDGTTGKSRWTRYLGSLSFGGIAMRPTGEVLVVGSFVGDMDIGGGPWRSKADGNGEVFVAELDLHGDTKLAARFGPGDGTFIAAGNDGHVLLAGGYAQAGPTLDPAALPACGDGSCAFVAELDASGKPLRASAFEGSTPKGLAVDSSGAVLFAGDRGDHAEPLLARFDRRGFFGGERTRDVPGVALADGLAIDASDRAIVIGRNTTGAHVGATVRWVIPP